MTTLNYNFPEFVFQQPGAGTGNYVEDLNDLSNGVDTQLSKTDLTLDELTTNQALNDFTVSEDITAGVWTIIITQDNGENLKFNIDGVIFEHSSDTMSVDGTSLAGTDILPNSVYVYVKETAGLPELAASSAPPEGALPHIDCKLYIVGAIGATTKTEYGGLDEQLTVSEFNTRVWHTAYEAGVKYRSGLTFDATLSSLTISVGEVRVVFKRQSTSQVSVPGTGFFHINALGEFISKNDFSFLNYSDGGSIASNKYYSVVFGVVVNNPTLMFAIVQKQPSTEYTSAIGAYNDELNARTIVPTYPQLTQLFLPICFGVVKNDVDNYLQEINGEYAHPVFPAGGSIGSSSISNIETVIEVFTPTAPQIASDTYEIVNGSSISYTPKWSDSKISYRYSLIATSIYDVDQFGGTAHFKPDIDGSYLEEWGTTEDIPSDFSRKIILEFTVDSWGSTSKNVRFNFRSQEAETLPIKLHQLNYYEGSSSSKYVNAILTIKETR